MTSTIKTLDLVWIDVTKIPKDRMVVCILREPLSRLMSSFSTVRERYQKSKNKLRKLDAQVESEIFGSDISVAFDTYLKEIFTHGVFDSHHLRQSDYLSNEHKRIYPSCDSIADRKVSDVTHFLCFDRLDSELKRITHQRGLNVSNINRSVSNYQKTLKPILKKYKNEIKAMYAEDFMLWDEKISKRVS